MQNLPLNDVAHGRKRDTEHAIVHHENRASQKVSSMVTQFRSVSWKGIREVTGNITQATPFADKSNRTVIPRRIKKNSIPRKHRELHCKKSSTVEMTLASNTLSASFGEDGINRDDVDEIGAALF